MKNIEDYFRPTFETFVNSDPTLSFFLNKKEFDRGLLEHQLHIRSGVFQLALRQWLDKKYPTNKA